MSEGGGKRHHRRPGPRSSTDAGSGAEEEVPLEDEDESGAEGTFRPNPAGRRVAKAGEDEARPRARSSRPESEAASSGKSIARAMGETMLIGRVRDEQLATFCRQLGTYLNSGVGVTRALSSLREQVAGTALGPIVERMGQAVKQGETISDAAAREPRAFDPLFLSMVRVAEARGGLPEALKGMASHYEARARFWKQARSAMIYPTIVIFIALVVGFLLTTFVLPLFVDILKDATRDKSASLPLPTQVLIWISDFMKALGWWLLPLLTAAGIFGLVRAYRTEGGKRWLDQIIVRVPVMGKLVSVIETARFSRVLGDLLDAGVGVDKSFALTADVMQFGPFEAAVRQVGGAVKGGSEVAPALSETHRFEPDVIAYVETGEETGSLPESLKRLAKDYEERATHMVKNLASLVQPLLVIVLGSIVGFIVIAFVMAYVSVILSLTGG
jgi:type II secretory pathway component PulF